jgi:hypothetical protein
LVAAALAVTMVATVPLLARADGSHDYYTTVVSTMPAVDNWQSMQAVSGTADAPMVAGDWGSAVTWAQTPAHPSGSSFEAASLTSPAPSAGLGSINMNRPGPFPGDVNDGAVQAVGSTAGPSPFVAQLGGSSPDGGTNDSLLSFWFKPEVASSAAGSTFMVYEGQAAAKQVHPGSGAGINGAEFYPGSQSLYILSRDNFATLCFGEWATTGSFVVGGPESEHCVPFARGTVWSMLSIYYVGCASGTTTCTLSLGINDVKVHTLTGLPPAAATTGSLGFGGTQPSNETTGFWPQYAFDLWGVGQWSGAASDTAMAGQLSSNGTILPFLFYAAGTGQPPAGTFVPPPLPGAPGSGTCAAGTSIGVLSGECKFQIGLLTVPSCAGFDTGWDIGADISWLSCEITAGLFTGVNALLNVLNAFIDIIVPGDQFFAPVQALREQLVTHAPFAYIFSGLTAIGNALSTGPIATNISLGSPTPMNLSNALAPLDPFRPVAVAVIWLGALVGIIRNARGDISGSGES